MSKKSRETNGDRPVRNPFSAELERYSYQGISEDINRIELVEQKVFTFEVLRTSLGYRLNVSAGITPEMWQKIRIVLIVMISVTGVTGAGALILKVIRVL